MELPVCVTLLEMYRRWPIYCFLNWTLRGEDHHLSNIVLFLFFCQVWTTNNNVAAVSVRWMRRKEITKAEWSPYEVRYIFRWFWFKQFSTAWWLTSVINGTSSKNSKFSLCIGSQFINRFHRATVRPPYLYGEICSW